MIKRFAFSRSVSSLAALVAAVMVPVAAWGEDGFRVAAADCFAIGQAVAAENGGTLARATSVSRGEEQICVIVVLVPGKDGERPRRAEFEVPAN